MNYEAVIMSIPLESLVREYRDDFKTAVANAVRRWARDEGQVGIDAESQEELLDHIFLASPHDEELKQLTPIHKVEQLRELMVIVDQTRMWSPIGFVRPMPSILDSDLLP